MTVARTRGTSVDLDAGLDTLSTRQAAELMGVPPHMVKHWGVLGLIHNYGGGGKGHAARWLRSELLTAPHRRKNLRLGWRGRPVTDAERAANRRLDEGVVPTVPLHLPYRALAYSCGKCGRLLSPTSIHRSDTRVMQHHPCDNEYVARRRVEDQEFNERLRARSRNAFHIRQRRTSETAHRRGYQWTGPELDIALRPDLTAERAAILLGRTVAGVMWARKQVQIDPRKQLLTDGRHPIKAQSK